MAASKVMTHARMAHGLAGLVLAGAGIGGVYLAGATPSLGVVAFYLVVGLAVGLIPALVVAHSLATPLEQLRQTIALTRNDGDLSRRAVVPPGSGIAATAQAYNELIASFQGIATRIIFTAQQVAEAADKLIVEAKFTVESSESQNIAAEGAAEAVAELSGGIAAVADNADGTAHIAQSAREHSSRGAEIVGAASAEIERIAHSVEQSARVIAALGERSEAISGIVKTIHDIADQTNLLALNAAIEAARAGEQGRGFAVVADEVRKLAERTTAATAEIGTMIAAIQSETQSAIATIQEGSSQARNGAELARQAADALTQINHGAQETMEKVDAIARAMAEQSGKTRSIAEHVTSIMGSAERNSEGARSTLAEANQLDYLATNLEEIGTVFKLGQAGEDARKVHHQMPQVVQDAARQVSAALEAAVDSGTIKLDDLFDRSYAPIANSKPPKFHTRFDSLCDRLLPAIQEPLLTRHKEITYAIGCDTSGYVPTHNNRFCQPLTGDEKKDFIGNRTKRIFSDPVGKRCGAHEIPFLLQTYRRDTGEIMHDISAPIYVKGRHWGGFRVGYRTE
ncbi:MAG: methyl-accepting chemotaxis protein [Rhodocyclaceae bacterium]|nr:methyl-accepting chemotaxis protein [Rhodocyclaceae bacterium]